MEEAMDLKRMTRREALKLMGYGMGAAVLAACAPKLAEPLVEATKAVPPTEAVKPVTLRYQNHWTKETDAHYKGMQWLYETFQKQNPNVKIENILNPDSIESYKKITADCASGDCPDIVHGPRPEMWESGYLLDLKPYLDKDAAWAGLIIPSTLVRNGWTPFGDCAAKFSPMPTNLNPPHPGNLPG